MFRQCSSALLVASFAPAAVTAISQGVRGAQAPEVADGLKNAFESSVLVAVKDDAVAPNLDECTSFSKALVYGQQGDRSKVSKQMHLVCSSFDYAPDEQICEAYLTTLLGHMHEDCAWNVHGMDYDLFCQGMQKILATYGPTVATAPAHVGLKGTSSHHQAVQDSIKIQKFEGIKPEPYAVSIAAGYGAGTQTFAGL
eukprot:TRINITY_DN24500_c0_g1_i1.p1 TRINITY_DN24500_c0_g1~~TRINITY_DN24500_c0_g1_i1.p1  ORF type:complete len:197 (+),score=43.40 TRINITY_DN24500_c0_g1_i1:70-660(+)